MTKLPTSALKKELAALPIARIETMDETYSLPLREYLFTNGCQVFVNSGPTENVTYFFVVGDSNFVKKTLAFRHNLGKKQCILCWDTEDHESLQQFFGVNTKTIYVNSAPLDPITLSSVFMFLFTTKGRELDLQTQYGKKHNENDEYDQNPKKDIADETEYETGEHFTAPATEMYEAIQKKRVEKTMKDMFDIQNDGASSAVKPKKSLSYVLFLVLAVLFIILTPCILYVTSFFFRGLSLYRAYSYFQNGKRDFVSKTVQNEELWAAYTHLSMMVVHPILRTMTGDKAIQSYERFDALLDAVADVEHELLTLNDAILSIGSSFLLEQKTVSRVSPIVAAESIRKSMPHVKAKLDLIAAYMQTLEESRVFPFSFPLVNGQMRRASKKLERLRHIAEVGERVSQIFPFIGGFKDKQTIIMLLQNSGELRPTGGFIGSVAHLTLSDGVLEEIHIDDVYTLDGQLKGHVNPPAPIKELLAQEHWYLRDSNWNPNFKETAKNVQFFYEKETGKPVDAIVGLTSSFIVKILRIVGPVDLPLYNDRITADNFYLKSLYYTQANFFPGSTQKKDFLGALMEALLTKMQTNTQSGVTLMSTIYDSLASRDIQWYMTGSDEQRIFEQFGWGGIVPAGTTCLSAKDQGPCIFAYLHINEANMSVNKVNAFIDRSQTRTVQISETGKISETIVRKIRNLSQGESGSGVYTTYIRLFFPSTATLTGLTIDGKSIPLKEETEKHHPLPYGELDMTMPGLTGAALAFDVEPGRERIIALSLSHQETILEDAKEGRMTLFEQKQPGVDLIPSTTSVTFPPSWEAVVYPSTNQGDVIANKGHLQYNTNLQTDSEFSFRLMR